MDIWGQSFSCQENFEIFKVMFMEWIPIFLGAFKGIVLIVGMFYAIKWHYDQDKKEKDAGNDLQSPTEIRYFVVMIIALGLSVIGIVYAGSWGNPEDGGRGGALGCILVFFMSFAAKPDTPAIATISRASTNSQSDNARVVSDPATLTEAQAQLARLKDELAAQNALFSARMESAWREKIYLGLASVVCAITWKFGAIAAGWLNFAP